MPDSKRRKTDTASSDKKKKKKHKKHKNKHSDKLKEIENKFDLYELVYKGLFFRLHFDNQILLKITSNQVILAVSEMQLSLKTLISDL